MEISSVKLQTKLVCSSKTYFLNLKNLLFDEQSKLVCTLKIHRKKCNDYDACYVSWERNQKHSCLMDAMLNYKPEEDADYEGVHDKMQDKMQDKLHGKRHDNFLIYQKSQ